MFAAIVLYPGAAEDRHNWSLQKNHQASPSFFGQAKRDTLVRGRKLSTCVQACAQKTRRKMMMCYMYKSIQIHYGRGKSQRVEKNMYCWFSSPSLEDDNIKRLLRNRWTERLSRSYDSGLAEYTPFFEVNLSLQWGFSGLKKIKNWCLSHFFVS